MTKKFITTLALSLCVSLVCIAKQAQAQETGLSPEEQQRAKEARELFEEGSAAFRAGDTKKAQDLLERSYNLRKSYDTAGNLGHVELKLGLYTLAARHLEYCLRNFPTGENQGLKATMEKAYAKVLPRVVTVKADVGPPGAQVTFGEHSVGRAPIEHPLFAKPHTRYVLTVEGSGGRTSSLEVIGEAGDVKEVELSLEEPGASSGVPEVSSGLGDDEPAAQDEEPLVEQDPWSAVEPPSEQQKAKKRNWVPAYILGGLTVAAAGTSIAFKVLQGGEKRTIDDLNEADDSGCRDNASSRCEDLQDAIDGHKSYAQVGDIALIATGVGAAATIGYVAYVLLKKDSPTTAGFKVSPHGGMLTLGGHF